MRAPFKTAAYLLAVAVALVVIAVAVGCGSARAQSWGVGGCPAPAPLPVWQPAPFVNPITPPVPPAPKAMPATGAIDWTAAKAHADRGGYVRLVVPDVETDGGASFDVLLSSGGREYRVGSGHYYPAGTRSISVMMNPVPEWKRLGWPPDPAVIVRPQSGTFVRHGPIRLELDFPPGCKCGPCDCNPCECGRPEQAPAPRTTFGAKDIPPGGVDWQKVTPHAGGEYRLNGRPCDPRMAIAAVGGEPSGGVPDDADHPWLTVIGPEADRDRVLTAVREGAAFNGVKLRLKGFPPGHKAVKDFPPGLIHLQAANGRPLLTLDRYDGPDKLAASIRAALEQYDPAQDPGVGKPYPKKPKVDPDQPRKPRPCDADGNRWVRCVVGFAAAVILFLLKRGA